MAVKKPKNNSSKAKYDAKKPTVSFRVSREEYERLDALRKSSGSFRNIILTGAGMMEKGEADEKERRAAEVRRIEEAVEAAQNMFIGRCLKCGKPLPWHMINPRDIELLSKAVEMMGYRHARCPK